jgi:hypothetical protein
MFVGGLLCMICAYLENRSNHSYHLVLQGVSFAIEWLWGESTLKVSHKFSLKKRSTTNIKVHGKLKS